MSRDDEMIIHENSAIVDGRLEVQSPNLNHDSCNDVDLEDIPSDSDCDAVKNTENDVNAGSSNASSLQLRHKLASWVTRNHCTKSTVNELLQILIGEGHTL